MSDRWLVLELMAWYLLVGICFVNTWVVMTLLLVTGVPAFWITRFVAYRVEVRRTLAEWEEKLKSGAAYKGTAR